MVIWRKHLTEPTLVLSMMRKSSHLPVFPWHFIRQQAEGRAALHSTQSAEKEMVRITLYSGILTLVDCQLPQLIFQIWLITLSTCQGRGGSERCCGPFWPFRSLKSQSFSRVVLRAPLALALFHLHTVFSFRAPREATLLLLKQLFLGNFPTLSHNSVT